MTGFSGLDYSQVKLIADASGVAWTTSLLRRISYLETLYLIDAYKKQGNT